MIATIIILALISLVFYRYYRWHFSTPTQFNGKTVLITGASSGIGEELTKQICRLGAKKIIIGSRRVEELERVKRECSRPEIVQIWQIDLNKPRECLEKAAQLNLTHLDILVNNGGVSLRSQFVNTDFDSAETLLNTNFLSHVALIKAFLPALEAAKGTIVNVSSVAGLVGTSFRTTYSASKFAIAGFSKALRPEVKQKGVKVLMVYPGYIQTGVSKNALVGNKDQRLGKTDSNIANGMRVEDCCRDICRGIFLNYSELIVAHQWSVFIAPYLPMWSWLEANFGYMNFKQQAAAI